MGIEPMTSALPKPRSTTELRRPNKTWSGRRDSNPQHLAWKASALPLRYARPENQMVLGEGFEPS